MENVQSIRETITVLLRHWKLIGGVTLGGIIPAALLAMFQTPIYESTAVLLIKIGREMISRPAVGDRETLSNRENAIIPVEIQILRSESVIEGAIEAVSVQRLYPDLYENPPKGVPVHRVAAARFRGNYIVRPVPASDVLQVSFRHPDPVTAADTVNVVVDHFKQKHLETFSGREATVFLEEKVESYGSALEKLEEDLREFRSVHAAFTVKEPGPFLMERRAKLIADREQVNGQILATRRRLAAPDNFVNGMAEVLSPDVAAQRKRDQAELDAYQAELGRLQAELRRTEGDLANLPARQKEYDYLVREREETEALYRTYRRKLAEARLSNEMDSKRIANISVIQDGLVPISPIRPNKRLYVAVGAIAGVVLGSLAAFLIESLRAPTASDAS